MAADGKTSTLAALSLKPPYKMTHQLAMERRVTAVQWHPKLNQIFVGTGDRSAGGVLVLYDPRRSTRGALLSSARQPRKKDPIDFEPPPLIHTPGALPMFRDDSWRKRKRPPDAGQVRPSPLSSRPSHAASCTPRGRRTCIHSLGSSGRCDVAKAERLMLQSSCKLPLMQGMACGRESLCACMLSAICRGCGRAWLSRRVT